jgi:hypothetical protein
MDKKIKFIPCDEKTLIGANHTTGKMKSKAYQDKNNAALTRRGKVRPAKKQQEVINKNKSYKDKNVAS